MQSQGPAAAATAPQQQNQGPPPSSRTGFSVSQGPGPPSSSSAAVPCPPPSPASATAAGPAAKPEQTKLATVPGTPITTTPDDAMDTAASPPPPKKLKTSASEPKVIEGRRERTLSRASLRARPSSHSLSAFRSHAPSRVFASRLSLSLSFCLCLSLSLTLSLSVSLSRPRIVSSITSVLRAYVPFCELFVLSLFLFLLLLLLVPCTTNLGGGGEAANERSRPSKNSMTIGEMISVGGRKRLGVRERYVKSILCGLHPRE